MSARPNAPRGWPWSIPLLAIVAAGSIVLRVHGSLAAVTGVAID
jgi:hypothetical protein